MAHVQRLEEVGLAPDHLLLAELEGGGRGDPGLPPQLADFLAVVDVVHQVDRGLAAVAEQVGRGVAVHALLQVFQVVGFHLAGHAPGDVELRVAEVLEQVEFERGARHRQVVAVVALALRAD
ncbi:hypothetical protein D9M71_714940 [compost metagenome]